ncbi:MAG: hydantoinase B/oxoprolinase family protein [Hyphomicrobiales bacterium]
MTGEALQDLARQVMWNRLISVVEEQAQTLVRTAFSTSVREAGDLSAGVFDEDGRMMAQAVTGTPGHVNAMAESVGHFIREISRQSIFEGDIYLTNDPWMGTGHLHDITVVSPSFHNGRLVGYFACTAHVVDMGGRGFGPDAGEVYEEGLQIPIMKFAERGEVDRTLIKLVRTNVREADQVVGDIYALAACNETGHRRLIDMMEEFELDDLVNLAAFIFEHSRRATLEAIAALPDGVQENQMKVDGYNDPLTLSVKLGVRGEHILADFAGTSPVSPRGINVPLVYTKAYACYGLKCAIAPDIPNNAASLEPFEITAPEGCILNAVHPAPVSVRHVIGHFIPDLVLGALHGFVPGLVPAEGASALWNIQISARPTTNESVKPGTERAEVLMFNSGGTGARPTCDGLNATAFPSGVMTMPIEATEQVGPIVIWRKELRSGSGGAGKFRGGCGQVIEISAAQGYEFHFNAMFDRIANPARGREGGKDGTAGRLTLDDGTVLKTKGRQFVPPQRRVVFELPGGGGYGQPGKREKSAIESDVANGYVSAENARNDYGVDI